MNITKTFHKSRAGFTLIELLVVIAIIGLLASVVLASLNSARAKAADSAIKQNLAGIRSQAEIVYSASTGDVGYKPLFDPGSTGLSMFNAALTASACIGFPCGAYRAVQANDPAEAIGYQNAPSSWYAWVQLRTDPTLAWCVDYLGTSKSMPKPLGFGVVTGAPYDCDHLQ